MNTSSPHVEAIAELLAWKAAKRRLYLSLSAQEVVLTASCFISKDSRIDDDGAVVFSDPAGDWRLSVGARLARIESSRGGERVVFGFSETVKLAAAAR